MKRPLALGIGLILILLLGWKLFKSPRGPVPSEGDGVSANPAGSPANAATNLRYDARITVRQHIEGQPEATIVFLKGVLNQTRVSATEYRDAWDTIDTFVVLGEKQPQEQLDKLYGQTIESSFDAKEQAYAHHFSPDFPKEFLPLHASLFHRLLLPMSLGDFKPGMAVTRKEHDEVGEYEAQYRADGAKVVKKWIRYLKDGIKVDNFDNAFAYTIGGDGDLQDVNGRLVLHYRQSPPTRFTIEVSLHLLGQAAKAVATVDKSKALTYTDKDIAKSGQSGSDRRPIMSFDEAMKQIDHVTENSDSAEVYKLFSSIKAGLDENPARAQEVIEKLKGLTARDKGTKRQIEALFGALSQAQDPATSTSLADLVESCPDSYCKIQAIAAVNTHPHPTAESMQKMLEVAETSKDDEIASTAFLAAGAVGSRLEDASTLSQKLINDVKDPSKAAVKSAVIAAMGNHGASDYLPTLESSLQDNDAIVRAAAAYSMRFVQGANVDSDLLKVVSNEKDYTVVRDALKALDYRSLNADQYEALAKRSATFSDEETQRIAARVLIQAYREDQPKLDASLKALRDSTSSSDIKEYIDTEMKAIEADKAAANEQGAPNP